MVYYNENDRFAAAWLRNLIAEGVIAFGEVDERSIKEVTEKDLDGFIQCHFFAGIGVWSYALRQAGWPDSLPVWTGSCPCQSFSASGKRGGFSDERHLWPTWGRLIEQRRPVVLFGEQVASKDGLAWFDIVSSEMERKGYTIGATDLCAAGVGAPHIRQRLFFVAHADGWNSENAGLQRSGKHRFIPQDRFASWVADAQRDGGRTDESRWKSEGREADGRNSEAVGGLAKSERGRCEQRLEGVWRVQESDAECAVDELVDASSGGCGERRDATLTRDRGHTNGAVTTRAMDLANDKGLERHGGDENDGDESRRLDTKEAGPASAAGPLNGFWRNARWIHCKDGVYRPTEPSIFPLVDGAPNRVGSLRGAGNALVAPAAQAFIEAFIEVMS